MMFETRGAFVKTVEFLVYAPLAVVGLHLFQIPRGLLTHHVADHFGLVGLFYVLLYFWVFIRRSKVAFNGRFALLVFIPFALTVMGDWGHSATIPHTDVVLYRDGVVTLMGLLVGAAVALASVISAIACASLMRFVGDLICYLGFQFPPPAPRWPTMAQGQDPDRQEVGQ